MKLKKALSIILAVCLLVCALPLCVSAAQTGVINGSDGELNVRDLPGGDASVVIDVLKNGTVVNIISTSGKYYYISYTGSDGSTKYGYVYANYVTVKAADQSVTTDVPSLYASYIAQLQKQHPNWKFKFYKTGISWNDVVAAQTKSKVNAISGAAISYRSTTSNFSISNGQYYDGYVDAKYVSSVGSSYCVSTSGSNLILRQSPGNNGAVITSIPNGTYILVYSTASASDGTTWYKVRYFSSYGTYSYTNVEGTSWFQPHGQVVRYYLDPRNFLNESSLFQFELLTYDSSVQTLNGVKAILKGSFMDNVTITDLNGNPVLYAQAIYDAGKNFNVSPYHLATRILQEVGINGSVATKGTSSYGAYYNFYNIGANTSVYDGIRWAKTPGSYGRPWDTQYKSIWYGAQFIANDYIGVGQSNLYFQKFDVISNGGLYNHQYMSNIIAPYSEASRLYKAYNKNGLLGSNFVFMIPVYEDMPTYNFELPASYDYPNMLADNEIGYMRRFSDVAPNDWYYDAVEYVVNNGYMNGYGNGRFGVANSIQRQDVATVIARVAGAKTSAYSSNQSKFPDVQKGTYYADSVAWASAKGIITGYNNGKFGVGDNVTREQICTMIYRYAQSIYMDTDITDTTENILKQFSDGKYVSEFAKPAVAWCVENGLLKGDAGKINPLNSATRAEFAIMVQRMVAFGLCYKGYPDVAMSEWYYEAVQFNSQIGYMKGYKNGRFGPADDIQRQDFIVILSRIANVDTSKYSSVDISFSDVESNTYYIDSVKWAYDSSIAAGYANGRFGVGDKLLRQDACVWIYRLAVYLGLDTSITDEETQQILSVFSDGMYVSDYAKTAVAWCIQNGVISGKNSTTLAPLNNINRAEVAQMLLNMTNYSII